MPEVFIQGGEGKLQAKYSPSEEEKPNIAIVLHPNPKHGGTMDSKVNYAAFKVMKEAGFSTCLLYTSPSPRDRQKSRMPSSA